MKGTVRVTVQVPALMQGSVMTRVPAQARLVTSQVRNEPVLTALRTLTKKDFSYDKAAWTEWWQQSAIPAASQEGAPDASTRGATKSDTGPKKKIGRPSDDQPAAKPTSERKPGN